MTTQTWKYRLDVSQLSRQSFSGFVLSLLSKALFSEIFSEMTKKIIFRVFAMNFKKTRDIQNIFRISCSLTYMFWGVRDKNLSHFANISSKEIDLDFWNCKKSSVIWRSRIGQTSDHKKLVMKDWHTTVTLFVKIWA